MNLQPFSELMSRWLTVRCLGRRPKTQEFYRAVVKIITDEWEDGTIAADTITPEIILAFAQRVTHHCPSRWNTIVAALRSITPHGKLLSRRALRMRQFTPPNQMQFAHFLAECDRTGRTQAGLVVRFLSYTGMRISEARALTWLNVFPDRIDVPAHVTKSGKARSIPLIPGTAEILARLRGLESGGHVLPRESPRTAIWMASARAGLPRMSFHCFRHLFATRCIESGVDMPTVARWLGHTDGGALLSKTYFHLVDEHSRTMAARVQI